VRTDSTGARLTPLLTNETLTRLSNLRLQTRSKFTKRCHGEHISGKGGTSIEFAD
jgi:hypothetical protein